MTTLLDTLEALERAATPGPIRVSLRLGGCEVVDGSGEWLAEFERAEDAEHYAATRNALPALLRVARACVEVQAAYEAHAQAPYFEGPARRLDAAKAEYAAALAALEEVQP